MSTNDCRAVKPNDAVRIGSEIVPAEILETQRRNIEETLIDVDSAIQPLLDDVSNGRDTNAQQYVEARWRLNNAIEQLELMAHLEGYSRLEAGALWGEVTDEERKAHAESNDQ